MGAITVRKVRGEVNPADLFTKHLPSREKVHQLMSLFGCEYRSGRAKAAPLLRPLGNDNQQAGHLDDVDPLPTFLAEEGEIHDESRLPHLYDEDEIEKHFPLIAAAPAQQNCEDWIAGDEDFDATEEYKMQDFEHGGVRRERRTSTVSATGARTVKAPARRADPHRK